MRKPALNKEKAKKDILKPSPKPKSSSRSKAATQLAAKTVTVGSVGVPEENVKPVKRVRLRSVVGGTFLIVSLLYALMLISYNPADPSFSHAAPNTQATNFIGLAGAWIADVALFAFGWSACWLVPVFAMSGWRRLNVRYAKPAFGRIIHLLGLVFLLCGSTCFEALRLSYLADSLPGEAGGVLGQALMGYVTPMTGVIGTTILMLIVTLFAVSVFFDFHWTDVAEKLGARLERMMNAISSRRENAQDKELGLNAQAERAQQVQKEIEESDLAETPEPVATPEVTTASHPTSPVAIKAQARVKQSEVAFEAKQEPLFEDSTQPIRPSLRLFDPATNTAPSIDTASLGVMSSLIENKLAAFGIEVKVRSASPGPVVTRYEIELAEGVKSSSVKSLESDLARVLSVRSVRVLDTVANTPYMGIEVPNPHRQIVKISELLGSEDFAKSRANLPLCLGKRITGEPFVADLAKMPHLLVAGTTGSGKSVGVNSMILSLLYKFEPSQLRLILVDPKKVEFAYYEDIPHLFCPVVDQMEEAKHGLQWCVKEMERRYKLAQSIKVRNIESFNARVREARAAGAPLMNLLAKNAGEDIELEELPYIVVVVDELADLLIVDKKGVEESLIRLAQKARAAGIHLILATQRPSADVISGLLRTNIPTRAAFQVATGSDSRIILDQTGAENLLGYGDFLFKMPNMQALERIQGAFVTDEELERVTGALRQMAKPKYIDDVLAGEPEEEPTMEMPRGTNGGKRDPLFDQAVAIILDSNKCSVTYLQRRLGVGYPRAANIVDELEAEGIVSPADSNGRRTINARNNEEL